MTGSGGSGDDGNTPGSGREIITSFSIDQLECLCEDHVAKGVVLDDSAIIFYHAGAPFMQLSDVPEDTLPEYIIMPRKYDPASMAMGLVELEVIVFKKEGSKTWVALEDVAILEDT